jgi:hypothetical protein
MQVFSDALGLFSRAEPLAYHMLYLESGFSIPVAPGQIDELKVEMRTLEVFQTYLESKAAYETLSQSRHLIAASTKSLVRVIQKCASPVCSRRQSWRGYCRGRTARATVTPRSITDHRRLCKTLLERNVRHGHLVAIRVKLHEGMF